MSNSRVGLDEVPESVDAKLDVSALGSRAVSQLVVRTFATRGITLVGSVFLARLLTPAEFGVFAVVSLIVVLASLVGDLGIEAGLVQQRDTPVKRELATVFTVQLVAWTAIAALIWLLAGLITWARPDLPPEAPQIAQILAVSLLVTALRAVPVAMLTRVLRFGPLAAIEIGQQVAYFGTAIALAASGYGVMSFAIATLVQSVLGSIAVYAIWPHWPGLGFDRSTAVRLWRFGVTYQAGLVLAWGREAVVPFFGTLAGGLSGVGFLGFAWRNGQLVASVEQIIARVSFPAFSRLQADEGRLARAAKAAIRSGFTVVVVVQAWIIATADILIPAVFSDAWIPAIAPLQLVCVASLAGAPTNVLRSFMYARGDGRRAVLLTTASLVVLFVTFPTLATRLGLVGAAGSFVLSSFVGLLLFAVSTREQVPFRWIGLARTAAGPALIAVLAALIVRALDGPGGIVVSGSTYGILVIGWIRIADPALFQQFVEVARRTTGSGASTDLRATSR